MKTNNNTLVRLIGVVVFVITFSISFVTYQSMFYIEPPIENITTEYSVTKAPGTYVVNSNATTTANESFTALVSKTFINYELGYQIELYVGDVEYEVGKNSIHRIFLLSLSTPPGVYCAKTILRWRPQFSLLDKKIVYKHGCFTINE